MNVNSLDVLSQCVASLLSQGRQGVLHNVYKYDEGFIKYLDHTLNIIV